MSIKRKSLSAQRDDSMKYIFGLKTAELRKMSSGVEELALASEMIATGEEIKNNAGFM